MSENATGETADRGTYELLRERLLGHGRTLRARVEQLNDERKRVFGGVEPELVATERVTTEHNCVPRDIAAVGERLLFGFNVHFGLKTERSPSDVFAAYAFREGRFHPESLELLGDATFEKDFHEVYRFYRDASFEKFIARGPHLYMQLRTGPAAADIKTFKWALVEGTLKYLDNRSDHEVRRPPQYDFEWRSPGRDDHVQGRHPHINIAEKVFVETIGGDLTIKVENNTESGEGIYQESVENADQTLDDAEIRFALLNSLVLLKIRPYQESVERNIVYCEKTRQAVRLDGMRHCCRVLPSDHGIIFPSGFWLHTGDGKTFEGIPDHAEFEQRIDSSNGEDCLYVFYDRREGLYVLIRYNVIAQAADPPLLCHGFTLFPGGELVCFRAQPDPQRHHAIQIWRTPFANKSQAIAKDESSELYKIGNRDIIRGLSECREILALLDKEDLAGNLYGEIAKRAGDLLDSIYWIRGGGTFRLDEPLAEIRGAAQTAIDEYEKVVAARESARRQNAAHAERARAAIAAAERRRFESVAEFVETLTELRTLRGAGVSLREVRYIHDAEIDRLDSEIHEAGAQVAQRCVIFLDRPEALADFESRLNGQRDRLGAIQTGKDAQEAARQVTQVATELELLIETVSNLPIEDATQRTRVVDAISALFANVNSLRAVIRKRRGELMRVEGAAEFASRLKLLSQAVINALDLCDSPDKCDQSYSRILLQLEELEGRFSEFEEFAVTLAEKREEIATAFETRKASLLEKRARRAEAVAAAADRLLEGVGHRARQFERPDEIHGYFASDPTIAKVRDLARELSELGEAVRADGLLTRLRSAQDDAVRQLKDRKELFAEGPNVISLGGFRFSVNTQSAGLTIVPRDGNPTLQITGTRFYEPVDDPNLNELQDCWVIEYVSETEAVYRGEYLAHSLFLESDANDERNAILSWSDDELTKWVGERMAPRYNEGYIKGVHDRDAARILKTLAETNSRLGPLRTPPRARALARLFWIGGHGSRAYEYLACRLLELRELAAVWPAQIETARFHEDLVEALGEIVDGTNHFLAADLASASRFLVEELLSGDDLTANSRSVEIARGFHEMLARQGAVARLERACEAHRAGSLERFEVVVDWVRAFGNEHPDAAGIALREEAAVLITIGGDLQSVKTLEAEASQDITGLLGEHARIEGGRYRFDYYDFQGRLRDHVERRMPRFTRFSTRKHEILEAARSRLRLDGFQPRVMASFVRNRLIDTAYLPLVGANLAKQIGVAGEDTRTDRQGLLLLISPPGYGKTTLMEYIADRLGLMFLKINGPAIGHAVTSLDPNAAPNLAAREELIKLGLGFEMGDNLMIYVDDIQHCHSEFLQKFISLCDAQRQIEGVWNNTAKTYDFRGRKVAVVMAGNPYTESGERFRIPDMLANRADVYNLGDVSGRHQSAFELSFIENSLTSNQVLTRLASHPEDIPHVLRLAQGGDPAEAALAGRYDAGELGAMISIMRKLDRVRDVVLIVNEEYIRSAGQANEFRTEPPFLLQGSYRNMNRIAEKLLPVMNEAELDEVIWSNYRNDAQTLTTGAEANLLKFRELVGWLSESEAARWGEIKATFQKNQRFRGMGDTDRFGQAVGQLSLFVDGLAELRSSVDEGFGRLAKRDEGGDSEKEMPNY